jgi:hypothetical protein
MTGGVHRMIPIQFAIFVAWKSEVLQLVLRKLQREDKHLGTGYKA